MLKPLRSSCSGGGVPGAVAGGPARGRGDVGRGGLALPRRRPLAEGEEVVFLEVPLLSSRASSSSAASSAAAPAAAAPFPAARSRSSSSSSRVSPQSRGRRGIRQDLRGGGGRMNPREGVLLWPPPAPPLPAAPRSLSRSLLAADAAATASPTAPTAAPTVRSTAALATPATATAAPTVALLAAAGAPRSDAAACFKKPGASGGGAPQADKKSHTSFLWHSAGSASTLHR